MPSLWWSWSSPSLQLPSIDSDWGGGDVGVQANKILESGGGGRPVKGRIMSRRKRLFALHTCQMGTLMASSRALDLDLLHSMTRKP